MIYLLNVSFNLFFFTKVRLNRLTQILHYVVRPTQTTFMPGRHILEGMVVLHETLHEIHSKKLDGIVFKVDFKKEYDKLKCPFLLETLRMKGFDTTWRKQVKSFIQEGRIRIKVNDIIARRKKD